MKTKTGSVGRLYWTTRKGKTGYRNFRLTSNDRFHNYEVDLRTFTITKRSLSNLKKQGVSDDVREKLKDLWRRMMSDMLKKIEEVEKQLTVLRKQWEADEQADSEQSVPLGEQVWEIAPIGYHDYCIVYAGNAIASVYSAEMRDIIIGIPGLVKACREHLYGRINHHNAIATTLEAMTGGEEAEQPYGNNPVTDGLEKNDE